jgi:hypothetical protein
MATLAPHMGPTPIMATTGGRPEKEAAVQFDVSREQLAELLRETERAHGEYERELGGRDDDWPSWYADYILRRLEGTAG